MSVQGECLVYDCTGSFVTRVAICFPPGEEGCSIVGVDWYNGLEGQSNPNAPTLAIALLKGRIQVWAFFFLLHAEVDTCI